MGFNWRSLRTRQIEAKLWSLLERHKFRWKMKKILLEPFQFSEARTIYTVTPFAFRLDRFDVYDKIVIAAG